MDPIVVVKWFVIFAIASTFLVETAFVEVVAAKAMLKRGLFTTELRLVAYFWLIVGYPADFVFNLTRGMIMFRTLRPGGWLFSARIDHYMRNPSACKRLDTAVRWAALLNTLDPGHTYWPTWARQRAVELGINLVAA